MSRPWTIYWFYSA